MKYVLWVRQENGEWEAGNTYNNWTEAAKAMHDTDFTDENGIVGAMLCTVGETPIPVTLRESE